MFFYSIPLKKAQKIGLHFLKMVNFDSPCSIYVCMFIHAYCAQAVTGRRLTGLGVQAHIREASSEAKEKTTI